MLVGRFSDGRQFNIGPILNRITSYTGFFSVAEGDLDGLYNFSGDYHDEVVVAWMEAETANSACQALAVPHVAVLNYDPSSPGTTTTRIDRSDNDSTKTCALEGYDYLINTINTSSVLTSVPQPNDTIIATTVGDFDGDGHNEIAVAYIRGSAKTLISIVIFRYLNDGTTALESMQKRCWHRSFELSTASAVKQSSNCSPSRLPGKCLLAYLSGEVEGLDGRNGKRIGCALTS